MLELLAPVLVLPTLEAPPPSVLLPALVFPTEDVAPPRVLPPVLSEFPPLLEVLGPEVDEAPPRVLVLPPVLSVLPARLEVLAPVEAVLAPVVDDAPPKVLVLVLAPLVSVLPPLLAVLAPVEDVLAPVVAEEVLLEVVVLPVELPPVELLLVLPPVIVPLVLPPVIVPVVVLVEFCVVWALFVGLMVRSDAFAFAEVPLWLLVLSVPLADDGLLVSPIVWELTAHEVDVAGQGTVWATACDARAVAMLSVMSASRRGDGRACGRLKPTRLPASIFNLDMVIICRLFL